MTENKRFNFVGGYLYDGNKPIGNVEDVKFRQDYEDIVNALHKENEQLKKVLKDTVSQLDAKICKEYSLYSIRIVVDIKTFRLIKKICKGDV